MAIIELSAIKIFSKQKSLNHYKNRPGSLNLIIFGLCSFFITSCSTTKNLPHYFERSEVFNQGFHGIAVFDPIENKMVYEHNAHKYFTPASNTKLFTLYTGLKLLNDSVPALHYIVQNDSLIFWGTGDPSLLNSDLPESNVLKFLKERPENLFFLPPPIEEDHFGPGWAWDDYNSSYSVERTSFPLFGNRVNFMAEAGNPVLIASPKIFRDSINFDQSTALGVRRDIEKNNFRYNPGLDQKNINQNVPFKYSASLVVNILSDTLQKEVKVLKDFTGNIKGHQTIYSIHVDSMYKRMMEVSDNFIAEQILLLSAQVLTDTLSSEIAIDHMLEYHLKDLPDEPQWVDGSGLSRYNLFTPRTMIALLSKIKNEVSQDRLFNILATGGVSGTLKNNYIAEEPYIFAKTGTLKNNHSLSGYLKAKSGKVLLFSIMNSNYTVPSNDLKTQMELILRDFYENY